MVLFESGFEPSGGYADWTSKEGLDSLTIITTDPHHGYYHASAYCNGGNEGEQAYLYKTFTSSTTVYVRAYFKFKTRVPSAGKSYNMLNIGNGFNDIAAARIYSDNGTTAAFQMRYLNGDDTYGYETYAYISVQLNTWYCVEIKVVVSGSAGEARIYVDGNLIMSAISLNNDYFGNANSIMAGENYSSGTDDHTIYFDCVKVDTSYIGLDLVEPEGDETFFEPAKLDSDPSTAGWGEPEAGILWYNKTEGVFRYWSGGTIKTWSTE